jgi:alpha-L-rhamnosidase
MTTSPITSTFQDRWRGQWIWSADEPPEGQFRRTVALRRTFALDATSPSAPARICADSRYVLWVNGCEVVRGPARINPRRRRYDVVDLEPYLVEGENCIGALGCFYARPTAWWMPAATLTSHVRTGGFLFEAELGDSNWLSSDDQWRASLLEGWTDGPPLGGVVGRGPELMDLRSLPADWLQGYFDDSGWPAARVMSGAGMGEPGNPHPPNYPHGPYAARSHGFTGTRRIEIPRTGDSYQSDGVVAGTLQLDVEGPSGAKLVLTSTEFVGGDGASSHGEPLGFTAILDGQRRTFETFDMYGLQEIHIATPPEVTVHGVVVVERLYPVEGDAAFSCSDETLNAIWRVGRRTVSLCSFDAYLDCPTREQRAWTGDSVVHQMVDLATNADWRLARWHPLLAAEPGPDGMLPMAVAGDAEVSDIAVIPDWALHWVHSVHNLWRYVGDREEIRRLLPVVEGVLRWFDPYIGANGLLVDVVGWVIIDWASVYTEGACAALNGLWGRSLLEFADMAEWLGDAGRAEWARATHRNLADGFEELWDPDRARYVDNMIAGVQGRTASQHGQAAAIVGKLAPTDRWARLVDVLTDESALVHATFNVPDSEASPNLGTPPGGAYLRSGHPDPWWDVDKQVVCAQPFFRYVVHDALAQADRRDLIPSQCLDWRIALERCATSWTETWFGGTVSHGWSSTPTRDLTTSVLGVRPDEPGFAVARIEPVLGPLAWAAGRVPCPSGIIDVRIEGATLEVTSPVPFHHGPTLYPAGTHQITSV